jgi:hypothetical protein
LESEGVREARRSMQHGMLSARAQPSFAGLPVCTISELDDLKTRGSHGGLTICGHMMVEGRPPPGTFSACNVVLPAGDVLTLIGLPSARRCTQFKTMRSVRRVLPAPGGGGRKLTMNDLEATSFALAGVATQECALTDVPYLATGRSGLGPARPKGCPTS